MRTAGRLAVDQRTMRVELDGRQIPVTPAEYRAIEKLATASGSAVPAKELSKAVHGHDEGSRNALEVLINRLRRKLGPGIILTRRGFGYYLSDETK
jgi:DNA-binding response OmpR family regulator